MRLLILAVFLSSSVFAQPAKELVGLWHAKKRFGPDIRGTMMIRQGSECRAEISGYGAKCVVNGNTVSFELAGGNGRFAGQIDPRTKAIDGHWFQAAVPFTSGLAYASPVSLARRGQDWFGTVTPIEEAFTFYLMVKELPDGSIGAFLRNPERNLGRFVRIDHLERDGERVMLVGGVGEQKRVWLEGRYSNEVLMIDYPQRGGTYDFRRVPAGTPSDFYPRGAPGVIYSYSPPPQLHDGWATASLDDVGLSRTAIEKFVQMIIDTPIEGVSSQEDHGILIARHGKLVLEEYFHGEHREKAHDTRSASKSVAADLIGAAIQRGVAIAPTTPVYATMNAGPVPADLDPRKRAITLEHLLTMSSGLDCDDNNPDSPGYEDKMWDSGAPDFYKWTLDLKMVRTPGEAGVYCSASPNLAGGMLWRIAKQSGQALFHQLLAEPLQISHYYLPTSPDGMFTMTGGARFHPRDFMKLAQVHLNGGTWNGRRIYSAEWSDRSTRVWSAMPTYKLNYGYLWWVTEYQFEGRTIRAYFASGNGGQVAMAIPELDLVLGFWAGNYNDVGGRRATSEYVPKYILPAVERKVVGTQ